MYPNIAGASRCFAAVVLQPLFCMRAAYPGSSYPVRKKSRIRRKTTTWFQWFQWMAAGGGYLLAI
jgi:hypothetical protein